VRQRNVEAHALPGSLMMILGGMLHLTRETACGSNFLTNTFKITSIRVAFPTHPVEVLYAEFHAWVMAVL
jgi:hypothetical protein